MNAAKTVVYAVLFICVAAVPAALVPAAAVNSPDPMQRRGAVLDVARAGAGDVVRVLAAALNDSSSVVRRTAARELRALGADAAEVMSRVLNHFDSEVRLTAFLALNDLGRLKIENIADSLQDKESVALRMSAVQILSRLPQSEKIRELLAIAAKDENKVVGELASNALNFFPFFRQVDSVRENADHIVNVIQAMALPAEGWKLKFDPTNSGHTRKWFAPGLDETGWLEVGIGKSWDDFGFKGKACIGWYRGLFLLPPKPAMHAVEICFEGVDESAWVWINGQYAGQHDVGPAGRDALFRIDVTPFVKWSAENQVTVRVYNSEKCGGIWKPARIEIIRLGN